MVSIVKIFFPGLLPSFLKVRYYRWFKGAKIGKGTKISFFSYISAKKIVLGNNCKIAPLTFIEAIKEVIFEDNVFVGMQTSIRTGIIHVGKDSEIMDNVRIGGIVTHRSTIKIGKQVGIFPFCYINPSYEITIEDGVGIGGRSHLFTHGGWLSPLDGFPSNYAPIHIGKKSWLAWRVTIVPGITIGERAIIQSETLVNKNVPSEHYARGNPISISKFKILQFSDTKKQEIIKNIMKEFYDYSLFLDETLDNFVNDSDKVQFHVLKGKKSYSSCTFWFGEDQEQFYAWLKEEIIATKNIVVLIYNKKIFDNLPKELNKKEISWFIFETKEIEGVNKWTEETRDFFKRFWILFDL